MSTQPNSPAAAVERTRIRPRTDIYETPEALVLVADIPGADPQSIELALNEDVLTLRARPRVDPPEGWQPSGVGFEFPDYERSFRLSADIERDSIGATLLNGRLRVELKKRQPRLHRIEVRAG
ncbi:MAG: Hsp20/alpha crystallin family protein [Planctomycetes bacterium]|nr:Hsp20/alpha crystallin family protein [Planctomycetota bacterium]